MSTRVCVHVLGAAAGPFLPARCSQLAVPTPCSSPRQMSQDLWDCGEPKACDDDEDWSEDEDSEATPVKTKKGHKRRMTAARQVYGISNEEREQQQPESLDDEDDPFGHVLAQQQQQQQASKRQKLNGAGSPLVLNCDDTDMPSVPRSNGSTAGAAGGDQVDMTVLGSKAQRVADAQRRLREQLQQLKQLEEQEDSDEPEVLEPSPEPAMLRQPQPVVDVLSPTDDADDLDSDPGASPAETAAYPRDDGAEGRLPLKFKTQGQEDVIVRIHPDEPLQAALARFRQYVCDQGWGTVSKFLSPEGDKLTGHETAQELALEEEDIIEVYLS